MRAILSFDPTAMSIEAMMNGNFATSFSGIACSPLEYVPASSSP